MDDPGLRLATCKRWRCDVREQPRMGTGHLRSGQRDVGVAQYEIHVGILNKRETVVELESPPAAQNGEILGPDSGETGRCCSMQVSGSSPYCRVIGGRLMREKSSERDDAGSVAWDIGYGRRHSDTSERHGDSISLSSLHGGRSACHTSRRDDDDIVLYRMPSRMGRASRRCRGCDAHGSPSHCPGGIGRTA